MTAVRLQKWLADRGLGSRREIERWIQDGRVTVNGEVASIGARISGSEKVEVDGKRTTVGNLAQRRVIAYYKPDGEVATRHDPQGRATVFDRLPSLVDGRWIAVGRLDLNTQGLLLLTNDGELANRLMHPRYAIEREYAVRVLGVVSEEVTARLTKGVVLEGRHMQFVSIRDAGGTGANHWYHAVLREGQRREVRRLWESQGLRVSRLVRVRYGSVCLRRGLRPGRWEEITGTDLAALLALVGLPPESQQARPRGDTGARRRGRRLARNRRS